MKKRVLSVLMSMALLTTILSSCGTSTNSGSSKPVNSGATTNETKTFTMFLRSTFVTWIEELKWYDEAQKRTGVKVELIKGPDSQNDTYSEVDQRLISSTLPDTTFVKQAQANVYGSEGAFLDLAPLIKEHAPNIQKYLDENPDYTALVTNDDGSIYGLMNETPVMTNVLFYRADQLEKAGVDAAAIETVEDFTQALRDLKAFYGKDNPNYYPLSGRETYFRFAAWFDCLSNISQTESNGLYYGSAWGPKNGYDIFADNFLPMMKVLKTWSDEGLVRPEWVQGAYSEGDWEAAMLNGECSFSYDFMTRPQWFLDNGGPAIDPDYEIAVLDNLKDDNGNILKYQTDVPYNETRSTVINSKVSDETAKTIIQYFDFFFSEEGQTLCSWGVEGESFKVVDGKKEFIVDYATEEAKAAGEKKWSFLNDRYTVCKPVDDEAFYAWNGDVVKDAATRLFTDEYLKKSYNIKYTDDQLVEMDKLIAAMGNNIVAELTSFVTGKKELTDANWTVFLKTMTDAGYARAEEIQLAAYKATYAK